MENKIIKLISAGKKIQTLPIKLRYRVYGQISADIFNSTPTQPSYMHSIGCNCRHKCHERSSLSHQSHCPTTVHRLLAIRQRLGKHLCAIFYITDFRTIKSNMVNINLRRGTMHFCLIGRAHSLNRPTRCPACSRTDRNGKEATRLI